jgi:hypothetical protein
VSGARNERSEDADVVKCALCERDAHRACCREPRAGRGFVCCTYFVKPGSDCASSFRLKKTALRTLDDFDLELGSLEP